MIILNFRYGEIDYFIVPKKEGFKTKAFKNYMSKLGMFYNYYKRIYYNIVPSIRSGKLLNFIFGGKYEIGVGIKNIKEFIIKELENDRNVIDQKRL